MLKQRVMTAVVLLALLALTVSAASAWPFLLFLAVACACAGWEWLRLAIGRHTLLPVLGGGLLFAVVLWQAAYWLGGAEASVTPLYTTVCLSVLVWLLVLLPSLYQPQVNQPAHRLFNSLAALVTLYATWGALAYWYLQRGALFVVSLLVLVWLADISAYFAGKAFGKHKLAPSISPGKTREGALAGVLAVVAWMLISTRWPGTFAASLLSQWSWVGLTLWAVLLAILSIAGDLYESLLKRRAQIKDSSQLLPGHGGVYDRIDAVVAVVPLAFCLVEWRPW